MIRFSPAVLAVAAATLALLLPAVARAQITQIDMQVVESPRVLHSPVLIYSAALRPSQLAVFLRHWHVKLSSL